MKYFLGFILIVFAMDVIGKLSAIKQGGYFKTPAVLALDAVANTAVLVWAAALLWGLK